MVIHPVVVEFQSGPKWWSESLAASVDQKLNFFAILVNVSACLQLHSPIVKIITLEEASSRSTLPLVAGRRLCTSPNPAC